jgi:hypothetical protein
VLTNLPSLFGGGSATQDTISTGRSILNMLFGGRLSGIIDWLASSFGIKNSSASSLLSLVAPVVLGVLRREQTTQGLSPSGLASLLLGQKDTIAKLAPTGLACVLGLSSLANLGTAITGTAPRVTVPPLGSGQVFLTGLGSGCHKISQAKHPHHGGGHIHDNRSGRI